MEGHTGQDRHRGSAVCSAERECHFAQKSEVSHPTTDSVVALAAGRYAELIKPGHILTPPLIAFAPDSSNAELGAVMLCRKRSGYSAAEQ